MTQAQGSTGRLLAGRYRLNEVLGRGGMGTVWRAEDEMLGRIVAVKELRLYTGVDEEEKHRLIVRTLREAKATARIRHTAAVTVFDVVEEDERPWIVMELVESRSLAEVIKEDGPLTPARAAEIALELLGVLGAAHSHGILHRDVKPSNVLIGEDGRVVLTDFGIASVEGDTSVTSTGMLVGAPSYISPERARGQKPGPPADLWSLGGTLYSMVEGRPPYDRGSALATLTAVMTEDLATPENAGPLRPVIEGLLEKDPAKRLDAATTRSMLRRVVGEAIARAESTTQVNTPPASAGAGAAGAAGASAAEKGRGVSGLLGTVRVGSRAGRQADSAGAVAAAGQSGAATGAATGSAGPAQGSSGAGAAGAGASGAGADTPGRAVPRKAVIGAAVVALLVLIAVVAVVLNQKDDRAGGGTPAADAVHSSAALTPAPSAPKSAPPSPSASPSASASASASPKATASSASPAAPTTAATPTTATVPAGYHVYRDSTGFTIAVPDSMGPPAINSDNRLFTGTDGTTLKVAWTTEPKPDALAEWKSVEEGSHFPGYQRVRMEKIQFRGWSNAADWEWTFTGSTSGNTMHALDRGFVTGKYGYAIYWTMLDSAWNTPDGMKARQVSYDSFQPAP
ncbi:serine/threonine-protein kinase [Kitasatospora sp. NPDC002227]|uniref:serine/threonine-protein kinase n=1 Tax=Kitasatospora sp. NPDC002227 TaxID=3154773 RepID=UPI003331A588